MNGSNSSNSTTQSLFEEFAKKVEKKSDDKKKSDDNSKQQNAQEAVSAALAKLGVSSGIGEVSQQLLNEILNMAELTVQNCIPSSCENNLMNMSQAL